MASNPTTLATYTTGAGLYVSGSVKTSSVLTYGQQQLSLQPMERARRRSNPGGPAGQVRLGVR